MLIETTVSYHCYNGLSLFFKATIGEEKEQPQFSCIADGNENGAIILVIP